MHSRAGVAMTASLKPSNGPIETRPFTPVGPNDARASTGLAILLKNSKGAIVTPGGRDKFSQCQESMSDQTKRRTVPRSPFGSGKSTPPCRARGGAFEESWLYTAARPVTWMSSLPGAVSTNCSSASVLGTTCLDSAPRTMMTAAANTAAAGPSHPNRSKRPHRTSHRPPISNPAQKAVRIAVTVPRPTIR